MLISLDGHGQVTTLHEILTWVDSLPVAKFRIAVYCGGRGSPHHCLKDSLSFKFRSLRSLQDLYFWNCSYTCELSVSTMRSLLAAAKDTLQASFLHS